MCVCVCMSVCKCTHMYMCGDQKTTYRSQLSPTWLAGLAAGSFVHWSILLPLPSLVVVLYNSCFCDPISRALVFQCWCSESSWVHLGRSLLSLGRQGTADSSGPLSPLEEKYGSCQSLRNTIKFVSGSLCAISQDRDALKMTR